MVLADLRILTRLCVLHVVVVCFQANVAVCADDHCCHCRSYADFCFFNWSLLDKVEKLSELQEIDAWSENIGKPLTLSVVSYVDCLRTEPIFVTALAGYNEPSRRKFLRDHHGFMMEFLTLISSVFMGSRLASNLSCFSPGMILQGDEAFTVELFKGLLACYQECGRLTALEAEGACNEFKSFLLEVRRRNGQVVSSIKDCISFMLQS